MQYYGSYGVYTKGYVSTRPWGLSPWHGEIPRPISATRGHSKAFEGSMYHMIEQIDPLMDLVNVYQIPEWFPN